ncbi:MAG: ABC transporter ATP-binding protein [Verrucomicrobiota bacterium]
MIVLQDLRFAYAENAQTSFSLNIPNWQILPNEKVALVGPSGSGKTTLLYLLAGILQPSEGVVKMGDFIISQANELQRRSYRLKEIGLIFQEFELLEHLTCKENMLLPMRLCDSGISKSHQDRVEELANVCGVKNKLNEYPQKLSHGERQRVALCRALISRPKYIFADEPTANLDASNKKRVLGLLTDYVSEQDATLIMVTHDVTSLERFNRVIDFTDFTQ